jgi:hypothetical protein
MRAHEEASPPVLMTAPCVQARIRLIDPAARLLAKLIRHSPRLRALQSLFQGTAVGRAQHNVDGDAIGLLTCAGVDFAAHRSEF